MDIAHPSWIPLLLPDLGADSVQVVQWLVDTPANVVEGDRILELLADGVLFHLSTTGTGQLARQDCRRGCFVTKGETLGWIDPAVQVGF